MFIEKLALNNYRNYDNADITFSDGINILYGDNAQGKTNILEAVYMTATTKSHRGSKDKDIIGFGSDESHIKTELKKNDISHRIDIHLRKNKSKGIAIDMIPIKRSADLFGMINIILFSPEDLTIIKDGPSERRRFMDMELCQLNRIYYNNLSTYNKILNQRNNQLKDDMYGKNRDILDVWDSQLIDYGLKIIKDRNNFIDMINEIIVDIHRVLTNDKEELRLVYDKNVSEDNFAIELCNKRDMDIRLMSTSVGPHRDDISFMINDIDVRKYGSQGQQRTVALSLKLAEIELVKKIINDNPILLLDDVMSELDSTRRDALLSSISNIQTIITCTGYDDFIKERLSIDKIYKVEQGKILGGNYE
ncbi:MAG: DNA replication/repair protein RecF [Lachnospiraceae bacterium]|nr:DNA replication/repair protein RecF [Lachnospiraceae bacterium]